jgi:hypothetical protein
MYKEISQCRISGSKDLITVLSLGEQYLTGVFPRNCDEEVTSGPVDLLWCPESGLLQLKQSYDASEMYGPSYGYRSGLNASMVQHLQSKVRRLSVVAGLKAGDAILDIGSNDATTLRAFDESLKRIGFDPTGVKFQAQYGSGIELVPEFFSARRFDECFPTVRPQLITSIAMFYDLEDPKSFVRDIREILDDEGVWHFEQSYMPSMLRTNSYDTICQEHIEYYSFRVISRLLTQCGMRVVDVEMNAVNGGSFAVTACKNEAEYRTNQPIVDWLLDGEARMGLDTPRPFRDFEERVFRHRIDLRRLVEALRDDGKTVAGYGASTKGNVLLQFCGLGRDHIAFIADVNEEKFGCVTPGTKIPIVSESEARARKPDYLLVLPWHFKNSILQRERDFLERGGRFIFPLPEIEIV